MKEASKLLAVGVVLSLILGACGNQTIRPVDIAGLKDISGNNTDFALDLYKKLAEKDGNLFLSPLSITAAMAMTYAGARAETATEMEKVLRFPQDDSSFHELLGRLVRHLGGKTRQASGYELSIANRLWGQKGYPFLESFLALIRTAYGAGLAEVDFRDATEEARKRINRWVEASTKERIKKLLKPGILNKGTRLVLTNAIYFKGDWAEQFDKGSTRVASFFLAGGGKVDVNLMYRMGKFAYAETADAQILELPYKGDEVFMVIFLPKEREGLQALEQRLSRGLLETNVEFEREVLLHLPRFKVTCEFGLKNTFEALGMVQPFERRRADFSGMAALQPDERLFISAIVHKAFVEVNEEGTEAAAATAVAMGFISPPPPPIVFRVDHPFLFAIRHRATGTVLFLGRVTHPRE